MWYYLRMAHTERYTVALGERGRLVLPALLRRRLNLHPGDRLIVSIDAQGTIWLIPASEQAQRLQGMYRSLAPDRSLADDLIADRHAEASHENAP